MKIIKTTFAILSLTVILIAPALLFAQTNPPATQAPNICSPGQSLEDCQKQILGQVGGQTGYGSQTNVQASDLANRVGRVIGMVLSVFGVVFLGLTVYSGIQWMTAGGNEEKVTKARERIIRAAIGLGIVMMSYALTSFIVTRMQKGATTEQAVNACTQNGGTCIYSSGGLPSDVESLCTSQGGQIINQLSSYCPDESNSFKICCKF